MWTCVVNCVFNLHPFRRKRIKQAKDGTRMFSVISIAICEGEVRVGYLPLLVGCLAAGVRVSANTGETMGNDAR